MPKKPKTIFFSSPNDLIRPEIKNKYLRAHGSAHSECGKMIKIKFPTTWPNQKSLEFPTMWSGSAQFEQGFFLHFLPIFCWYFKVPLHLRVLHIETSSKIWQIKKKSLVQLALNPILEATSKTRLMKTRSIINLNLNKICFSSQNSCIFC